MNRLLFSTLIILLTVGLAVGQDGSSKNSAGRPGIDRDRLNGVMGRENSSANEAETNATLTARDLEQAKRLEIARDLKQLDDLSESMLTVTKAEPANLKQLTELASKIAKLSRRLRHELNLSDSKTKPSADPALQSADRQTALQRLAAAIDKLVDSVRAAQSENTVNAAQPDQLRDQLELIELYANNARALGKEK